jgi:tRNA(fMet)-specific endonuclease VapC
MALLVLDTDSQLRRVKRNEDLARVYQHLADGVQFLGKLQILSFTERAILRFEGLLALKLNVRAMDLRIAAIVLEHGATLVTRNTRDFQRVPNLVFVDWSK